MLCSQNALSLLKIKKCPSDFKKLVRLSQGVEKTQRDDRLIFPVEDVKKF